MTSRGDLPCGVPIGAALLTSLPATELPTRS